MKRADAFSFGYEWSLLLSLGTSSTPLHFIHPHFPEQLAACQDHLSPHSGKMASDIHPHHPKPILLWQLIHVKENEILLPQLYICQTHQRTLVPLGPHAYYRVQAHSARHMRGQWIWGRRCWVKEETLIGEQADQEDGRLVPKITILLGSGCQVFYQSERKK